MAQHTALRHQIIKSFQQYDDGQKGWLTRAELKCSIASLAGYKPTKTEINSVFQNIPDERITQEVFVERMEKRLQVQDPDERIRQIFKTFDYRCSGFINEADLLKVFASCAPHIPQQTVSEVFREIDSDRDGRVSCREFVNVMKFAAPTRSARLL
mmetsp:Transcript_28448/g.80275  ORF Transcript_28448/g.80275 Transcript_28448/m.80275 type:complete len:155 (-) Transcript_28448:401-865(-)|eukprot:CAMPEP_0117684600 /NCGR_PEP_ID=MMETSP0804-20121206/21200_1 /TAXON_ID=1074897 /ORGANISM="Tetraselmis astigmatica, Strain CCMP880" /LENGTH=154 /DNA_ID=CAMNT_0005495631 /DNA_START=168 /DNA_END=632 /DNA_ORIENTATION=+